MFNLNLNLYTVEQVNHVVDSSSSGIWDNGNERALNDVVDPNTEFQVTEKSPAAASPLESFGFQTLVQTPPEPKSPTSTTKLAKQNRRLSDTTQIPLVHAYVPIIKMPINRVYDDSQPKIHRESLGKVSQNSSNFISSVTEDKSYIKNKLESSDLGRAPLGANPVTDGMSNLTTSHNSVSSIDRVNTSEQLAWALRSARDRLETASNMSGCSSRFEVDSNCSERADSMSTFSDVSGYEEELFRMRLLLQDSSGPYLDKHFGNFIPKEGRKHYVAHRQLNRPATLKIDKLEEMESGKEYTELHTKKLNALLQAALSEKEKYKIELDETKMKYSLEWQQKYQDLLRQKANTDGRLERAHSEIETLRKSVLDNNRLVKLNEMRGNVESELEKLQQLHRDLQTKSQEQNMQAELGESEINRWKEEAQETEAANERLRVQLQELRMDTESKDGAIQGLKMKLADQHVELQSLLQAKLKAENALVTAKAEMETIRKSGSWYRDQLHANQAAKVKVQQELMTTQASEVTYRHLVEKLKGEASNLRSITEETQQRAVREKDKLMRKLEMIHADMLEREAAILNQVRRDEHDSTVETISAKLRTIEESRNSESTIFNQELEQQIGALRLEIQAKDDNFKKLRDENAALLLRNLAIQKTMDETELSLQSLEIRYKNLDMNNCTMSDTLRSEGNALLQIKNEKIVMEVALKAAEREKKEVDSAIKKLREDFARVTKSYQTMRGELRSKEKEVHALETEKKQFLKDKEQHNLKMRDMTILEAELKEMRGKIHGVNELEKELKDVQTKNDELICKIRETNDVKESIRNEVVKLEETLSFREEQLLNQTQSFEVHTEELKCRDRLISTLQVDKRSLQDEIENLKLGIAKIEELSIKKSNELKLSNSQLARSNFVIGQFNELCRGSEQENHKLKQLIKDSESVQSSQVIDKVNISVQTGALETLCSSSQTTVEQLPILDQLKVPLHDYKKEIEELKCSLRMTDIEKRDKQRRYEINIRTLLKKVKEHMRGRKIAEKAMEELSANLEVKTRESICDAGGATLQAKVLQLEAELESSHKQYTELQIIKERSEEMVLELERERGMLMQSQEVKTNLFEDNEKPLQNNSGMIERIQDLEEQLRKHRIIIKELRKQIFVEKRDSSQLRKQVSSLRMGMDTANDVLDNKKIDLGRSEAMGEVLRDAISRLQRELDVEQVLHETSKDELEKVKMELEETRAKDPMLADQIKMLSYHLHEKTQEVVNLKEHDRLSAECWTTTEDGLKRSINILKEDIAALHEELKCVRGDKFALQGQAVELRAGLQSSLDQNKLLRLKVEAYDSISNKDSSLPDLTSSLPSAPMKYNEFQIAELLDQGTTLPCNKPLNNLQSCLDSLKQEMATLQQQLIAKTSTQLSPKDGNFYNENGVKDI